MSKEEISFFWGRQISSLRTRTEEIIEKASILAIFLLLLLSIIAKVAFVTFIIENSLTEGMVIYDIFFGVKDYRITLMWFGFLIDMYIFYHLSEKTIGKPSLIEKLKSGKASKIDVSKYCTQDVIHVIEQSWNVAKKYKQQQVAPLHIFVSLLNTNEVKHIISRLNIDMRSIAEILARQIQKRITTNKNKLSFDDTAMIVIESAAKNAYGSRKARIDVMALFLSLLHNSKLVRDIMYEFEVNEETVKNTITWIEVRNEIIKNYHKSGFRANLKPRSQIDRAKTGIETPLLTSISSDMTNIAARSGYMPLVGRQKEMNQMVRSLELEKSVLLSGPFGVGKTSLVEGLARRMAAEDVPKFLKDKRLFLLSAARLISGTTATEAGERIIQIFDEAYRSGNIVLVIEDINLFMGISAGDEKSMDLADIVGNLITKKAVYVIGTAEKISQDASRNRRAISQIFRVVEIQEPEKDESIQILASKTLLLENKYNVFFTYEAIEELYNITEKFLPKKRLPKKAVDLLEEISTAYKGTTKKITRIYKDDIDKVITEKIKIPLTSVGAYEKEKLMDLENLLHKKIISQNEAVRSVSNAIRRAKAELEDRKRPIANLLFLGPTGVGKTALAKALSEIYFGNDYAMTRLDMNEYQTKDSIKKLIGGRGESGILTSSIEKHPYGLLLLDELEKADTGVMNIFLQLMDEGRITDGSGVSYDASHILLIATSNAGSQFIQDKIREKVPANEIQKELRENELKGHFSPEFLNRFDDIIMFHTLSRSDVVNVAKLMIQDLQIQMEKKHGVVFKLESEALIFIASVGYKEEYGAREMRRAIERFVENPLSKILLQNKISRRDTIIMKGEGSFHIQKAPKL